MRNRLRHGRTLSMASAGNRQLFEKSDIKKGLIQGCLKTPSYKTLHSTNLTNILQTEYFGGFCRVLFLDMQFYSSEWG